MELRRDHAALRPPCADAVNELRRQRSIDEKLVMVATCENVTLIPIALLDVIESDGVLYPLPPGYAGFANHKVRCAPARVLLAR